MNDHACPRKKSQSNLNNERPTTYGSLGSQQCGNCGEDVLSRKRTFSPQAWTALLLWNEITPSAVNQAICDLCYEEKRDILMDRTEDLEETLKDRHHDVLKVKKMLSDDIPS